MTGLRISGVCASQGMHGNSSVLHVKSYSIKTPNKKYLTAIPEGEDETFFEQHNRILQYEWRKSARNVTTVEDLMTITFPMRRKKIMESPSNVQMIFK